MEDDWRETALTGVSTDLDGLSCLDSRTSLISGTLMVPAATGVGTGTRIDPIRGPSSKNLTPSPVVVRAKILVKS